MTQGGATGGPVKVYAVVRGEYSDYRVCALFERKEDAETAVAAGMGEDVEDFTLYPAGVAPKRVVTYRAGAIVGLAQSLDQELHTWSSTGWDNEQDETPPKRPTVLERETPNGTAVGGYGANEESVIKAVADRVAKLKAQRAGL